MIELLSLLLTPPLVKVSIILSTFEYLLRRWFMFGSVWPGNILNFNVGASVDLDIPRSFWSRLAGKYGNIFYWKEKVKFLLLPESLYSFGLIIFSCGWAWFCMGCARFCWKWILYFLLANIGGRCINWSSCNGNI